MPIKFGTDGWRALMAEDFTFGNVRICAQATADLIRESGMAERGLLIGYDTRLDSENFALNVAEVVARNGIAVMVTDGHVPTPMLSHGVVDRRAGGGVVITASHNPPEYNGYKYKPSNGGSAPDETVARLEHHIRRLEAAGGVPEATGTNTADIARVDLAPSYLGHIGKLVDLGALRASGLKLAVDPMYGSGLGLFPRILSGGSTSVTEIHGEVNPTFPDIDHPEPIGRHLSELRGLVTGGGFDIGIANDGDADRLGLIDEKGRFVTTLQTFSLLCLYELEVLGRRGALVRSLTQSVMVDKLAAIYDVPVTETKVGFKHIAPLFQSQDILIAGEESGGYTVRGHVPERDGILCGLLALDLMVRTGKRLSELVDWLTEMVGPHHFNRVDLEFPQEQRDAIVKRVESAAPQELAGLRVEGTRTDDGYKFNLAGGYWMLVRFSGTEPLLRTYAEADTPERVARLLDEAHQLAFA